MIKIIIADDDSDVRLSLVNILQADQEIQVIGEASNGLDAVKLAKALLPDLVLMDIVMPIIDGLESAKRIKESCRINNENIKVLLLSTFYDDDLVIKARENGVDGYLLKGFIFDKLATAIKNTYNGFITLDRIVYDKQNKLTQEGLCKKKDLSILTVNEQKILELIVNGKKNAEIAAELFLSVGTVRNYISSMLSKLECKNGRDLAVFGIRAGL